MKARVTLFKMRVKTVSAILSVKDIESWEKLNYVIPEYSDVTRLPDNAGMEELSFSAIRVVYVSVN